MRQDSLETNGKWSTLARHFQDAEHPRAYQYRYFAWMGYANRKQNSECSQRLLLGFERRNARTCDVRENIYLSISQKHRKRFFGKKKKKNSSSNLVRVQETLWKCPSGPAVPAVKLHFPFHATTACCTVFASSPRNI